MQKLTVSLLTAMVLTTGVRHLDGQTRTAPPELPHAAARMYAIVKTPRPGELKWQEIPWLTDLSGGLDQAKKENRPLLLWVSGDDPLEKC
jgi:hypothetical protein